jgi:hypothetical protein
MRQNVGKKIMSTKIAQDIAESERERIAKARKEYQEFRAELNEQLEQS